MTILTLYSGNGVSYSTKYEVGMHVADKKRCIADEGKVLLLDGEKFSCRDVLSQFVRNIQEVDSDEDLESVE